MSGARILVADDEPEILRALRANLGRRGYDVAVAEDGAGALRAFAEHRPDVVILDLCMPQMDGAETIRRLREQSTVPIIVLSVQATERQKVAALDAGADDYVTKPFGVDELLARVRAALRRSQGAASNAVCGNAGLRIDVERRAVSRGGVAIHLTPTEYDLLRALASHPNKVLTHRMLLQEVWGDRFGANPHYLHVYMTQLRRKLEADPNQPPYIVTEPGVGYCFRGDS